MTLDLGLGPMQEVSITHSEVGRSTLTSSGARLLHMDDRPGQNGATANLPMATIEANLEQSSRDDQTGRSTAATPTTTPIASDQKVIWRARLRSNARASSSATPIA